ncbi:hypothetical protein PDE_06587 [Penicillium oxalicum 114-2]|uniref:Uncharacterized protein n=1 Tax=Penicillium oxalicum (strain 114-2 / CGMCC 5302) TaxID=933388 RepID=S8BA00_PENO1|nr:hypothetical protein PDE_06587 [Penicillium oxalicum 114-2]
MKSDFSTGRWPEGEFRFFFFKVGAVCQLRSPAGPQLSGDVMPPTVSQSREMATGNPHERREVTLSFLWNQLNPLHHADRIAPCSRPEEPPPLLWEQSRPHAVMMVGLGESVARIPRARLSSSSVVHGGSLSHQTGMLAGPTIPPTHNNGPLFEGDAVREEFPLLIGGEALAKTTGRQWRRRSDKKMQTQAEEGFWEKEGE